MCAWEGSHICQSKRQASGKARCLAPRTVRGYSGVLVTHMWHCIKFALASDLRGLEERTDGVETVGFRRAETMSACC